MVTSRSLSSARLITAASLIVASHGALAQAGGRYRIAVEPDFLASRDGNSPHVEMHVAANPRRARNPRSRGNHPHQPHRHPGDQGLRVGRRRTQLVGRGLRRANRVRRRRSTVAFTPRGTALLATLNQRPDETGRTRTFLNLYRSEDGGTSWSPPTDLGASYDHEMIAVDHTLGRFAGRIYLAALFGREYELGLFRSDDDGRSFIGPVVFHRTGGRDRGANTLPMAVFSDGALLAAFHEFPLGAERSAAGLRRSPFFTVLSTDGGVTFTPPRSGPLEVFPAYTDPDQRLAGDAAIAVDHSPRFRDRVYRVWQDARFAGGRFRLVISTSDDRGATWSEPRMVDPGVPASTQQFLAAISVNAAGVLGVSWQDSRDAGAEPGYHVYFSASVDGGATFLAAQRISSAISRPLGSGNLAFTPSFFRAPGDSGATRLTFLSAANRWPNGGDYSGMAADAEGVFHPFWADARTGTFQAWTARVRVDSVPASSPGPAATTWPVAEVTSSLTFVSDPTQFDAATRELVIPLRLKNSGSQPIGGPITITVQRFGSGLGEEFREMAPAVLNASNGRDGAGATFILDDALGTERLLRVGETSGPVLMRFRVKDPLVVPNMHLLVSGRTPPP